jgi:hypothetical protein
MLQVCPRVARFARHTKSDCVSTGGPAISRRFEPIISESAFFRRGGGHTRHAGSVRTVLFAAWLLGGLAGVPVAWAAERSLPPLSEVVAAKRDLWGELALQQPNGVSYEFFESLLPPPRYFHADFRYNPLVLRAPGAKTKARLISNGSGVNLRGGSRSGKDVGTAVVFRVGPDEFRFGDLRDRLSLPQPADGWLPVYEITYRHPTPVQAEGAVPIDQKPAANEPEVYRLEAFVSIDPAVAENAVVFVCFSLAAGSRGIISVQPDPPAGASFAAGEIRDAEHNVVALVDPTWKWERQGARARLEPGRVATLAIPTVPLAPGELGFDQFRPGNRPGRRVLRQSGRRTGELRQRNGSQETAQSPATDCSTRAASATENPHGWQGRSTDEQTDLGPRVKIMGSSSVLRLCHPCASILGRAVTRPRPLDRPLTCVPGAQNGRRKTQTRLAATRKEARLSWTDQQAAGRLTRHGRKPSNSAILTAR